MMYNKTSREIIRGKVRAHACDTFTSSLSNLSAKELESVKQSLSELGRMLSDLSYRRLA